MEDIELFNIKLFWGNFGFEYEYGPSVGNSSGNLCICDPRMFRKINSTISDYFVMIQGEWVPNGKKIIIISVYAPQELCVKKMLWDYVILVLNNWNGEVLIMGDFNEVRTQKERHGSIFNVQGADAFNLFISTAGLEEVPLDRCKFTWCHKSALKMSKLDRFIISEGLMNSCPNISAITLDRYLSDHRPILMHESHFDYGPTPFCFSMTGLNWKRPQARRSSLSFLVYFDHRKPPYLGAKSGGRSDFNIDTILHVLDCFYHASGLHINMIKSKLMGISVSSDKVDQAAKKIGCAILKVPFSYLGSKVGCLISRIQSWNEIMSFFNGVEHNGKKQIWVKWSKVLASKENGGHGVLSFYALNRALLFKWVWRFRTQQSSLWTKVIKGIHGEDGKLGNHVKNHHSSIWGNNTLKSLYPRMYALETHKNVTVASKMSHVDMSSLFRRAPRGGFEESQFTQLLKNMEGVSLVDIKDRSLPVVSSKTRWIHAVPIKVNIHAWKVRLDSLPTRLNISKRGMDIELILCPICDKEVESTSHIFFTCHIAREIFRKILFWWDINVTEVSSYEEWLEWLLNIRLHSKHKKLLEGVCYVMWALDLVVLPSEASQVVIPYLSMESHDLLLKGAR
ncbi:RNA-directed DNA polymerase, eukaryota, reverse transcriptase zinc-binding domain protein [Tanacetum coccineum]